jgi:hypothetical protein
VPRRSSGLAVGRDGDVAIDASDATKPEGHLEGVTVKVCAKFDTPCTGGAGGPLSAQTDANGEVEIAVPTVGDGFDGFLELSAPGYKTVLWLFPRPIIASFGLRVLMCS